MKQQMPIKQEQVEQLIGGVVAGYTGLVNLSGLERQKVVNGNDLFVGTATVSLNNKAELGTIVNNMFSFGLNDVFLANNVFRKQIGGAGLPQTEEIDAMLNAYKADVNKTREQVNNYLSQIEETAENKVELFKAKIELLNDALLTKNVQPVADALEAITGLTGWNAEVNTKSLYDAGKAIYQVANHNINMGFSEATDIW